MDGFSRCRASHRSVSPALLCLLVSSLLIGLPRAAWGTTVYSNIVGNCCGGNGVEGTSYGAESLGEAFVAPTQGSLQNAQVEVFAVQGFGGDPYFNVLLFSNSAGTPGSVIATLGTNLQAPTLGGLITASGANPLLTAGTEYWLVLTPYDSSTDVGWEQGGSSSAPFAFSPNPTGSGGWVSSPSTNLQFAINVTSTPEPAPILLLSSGVIGVLSIVRRRVQLGSTGRVLPRA